MAKSVVRGKALVAKLRGTPGVRDPEALAVWAGRLKTLRKAGKGAVTKLTALKTGKSSTRKSPFDDDDPFNEDHGGNEPKSKEDKQRERYESQQIRALEKAERGRLNSAVMEAGGLKTRVDLREEYAGIPNTFKRKDGLAGDEMAEYLGRYYPEFGIEDERDLIDFLAA